MKAIILTDSACVDAESIGSIAAQLLGVHIAVRFIQAPFIRPADLEGISFVIMTCPQQQRWVQRMLRYDPASELVLVTVNDLQPILHGHRYPPMPG